MLESFKELKIRQPIWSMLKWILRWRWQKTTWSFGCPPFVFWMSNAGFWEIDEKSSIKCVGKYFSTFLKNRCLLFLIWTFIEKKFVGFFYLILIIEFYKIGFKNFYKLILSKAKLSSSILWRISKIKKWKFDSSFF